uniref:Uncharacterized protein LOC111133212 n=1 Tax=Crassostrea virginica TaxID=6565 RepID=A0A8B8E8V6_CRAVI|nr:uncharacterized protein LOC111133212 [Crassostrea virginica]
MMAGLSQTGIFICFLHCVFAQRMFYISGTTAGVNNTCGDGFTLAPRSTEKVTLQSSGRLPQGYCEVTVGINNSQRCKRQICVQGNGTLDTTGIIFKFTQSPSKKSTEYRGPNYGDLQNEKCFDGYSLFLNISEPDNVANNFNFQLIFRPICNDSNSADQIAASDADSQALNTKEELERAWLMTTVYGAITGVCLAIVFLIILFITWCYYKSYPYGNKKRETKKEVRPKSVNYERQNMEEMKLLEPAEPVGDSSGLGLSDKDVVDLEEGTSPKKGEPEKQEEEEPEEKMVVEEETGKEQAGEKKEMNMWM